MSARFTTNFLILLLGAGLVVATFAFSHLTSGWVALGVGAAGFLVAAHNFALPYQGTYQRVADIVIALVSAWAIVAAEVMTYGGRCPMGGARRACVGLSPSGGGNSRSPRPCGHSERTRDAGRAGSRTRRSSGPRTSGVRGER